MNERFTRAAAVARIDLAHEPDFELGGLQVRPSLREIAWDGRREIIDRRVMQVLVALARADGGVVSRDDLIESCWDGVVVGEDAITNCVGRLRKVAEAGGNAFTVETVPRVGYRLRIPESETVVPNVTSADAPGAQPHSTAPEVPIGVASAPLPAAAQRVWMLRVKWIVAISAVVLVVFVIAGIALRRSWPSKLVQPQARHVEASVAVLPFANMSGNPAHDYFSDGFSEELRSELSNDPRLRVAARVSAFAFRGVNEDVKTIARTLRVGAIVEGTVREAGNRVRITAELANASDGFRTWSATYDRDLSDILNVQSDVARAVAAALTRKLLPPLPTRRPRIDPKVYRDYLEARREIGFGSPDNYHAYLLLKSVTKRQPDFAKGWAALAGAESTLAQVDDPHALSWYAMAGDSATRALMLDPHNLGARDNRELSDLAMWNWSEASSDFQALRAQSRNRGDTLDSLRVYYLFMGFPAQAVAAAKREITKKADSKFNLIVDLEYAGLYRELISTMRSAGVEEAHDPYLLQLLCEAYAMTGQVAKAGEVREMMVGPKVKEKVDEFTQHCEFYLDAARGDTQAAHNMIRDFELRYPNNDYGGTLIGEYYVVLKDFDNANDWFERAYARREQLFFFGAAWPPAADCRKTARWKALTQQPLFKEWQAEHDRIAATIAAHHGDPLQ